MNWVNVAEFLLWQLSYGNEGVFDVEFFAKRSQCLQR